MFASRLWWMLRWLGHDAVAVLDGGFAAWVAAGHPVSSARRTGSPCASSAERRGRTSPPASTTSPRRLQQGGQRLLDAGRRSASAATSRRSTGWQATSPARATTSTSGTSTTDGRFLPPAALREQIDGGAGRRSARDRRSRYCGSGVTAAHNLLAMEHAGLRGARLYVGSWSEWSSDERRGVERS